MLPTPTLDAVVAGPVPTAAPAAPQYKYGAPVVTGPPEGREYDNNRGTVPILTWQPVADLAPNEYYHITFRVKRQNGEIVRWIGMDTASTQLIVTEQDAGFMRTSPQMGEVSWFVVVLSQPGQSWAQGKDGVPISGQSETHVFWMKP